VPRVRSASREPNGCNRRRANGRQPSARARGSPCHRRACRRTADEPHAGIARNRRPRTRPPNGAVGPQAGAIERDADHWFIEAVLGHATGHVGVVVLDRHKSQTLARCALARIVARCIIRVQIVDDHCGAIANNCSYRSTSGQRPGTRPNDPSRPCDDSETPGTRAPRRRPLELTSDGQHRRGASDGQLDRLGSVAPRPPHRRLAAIDDSRHRIVAANVDRTVVRQETSAIDPSRLIASSSRKAIGSSERLPLVITKGAPSAARMRSRMRRWCRGVYGSMTPK